MFKRCSKCQVFWTSRNELLDDPNINFIGYQSGVHEQTSGYFLFNHTCGGTIALSIFLFADYHNAPILSIAKRPGSTTYCLSDREMMACPSQCACEFINTVGEKINSRNKVELQNNLK